MTVLRALLFDFDGVLADTEPLHFQIFQKVFKKEGIDLSEEVYYERYLGLDDRGCFQAVFHDQGLNQVLTAKKIESLIQNKNAEMLALLRHQDLLLPGARELVEKMGHKYFMVVVSGALRSEIETVLEGVRLRDKFQVIVGANDVMKGKPDPEGYLTAVRWLNRDFVPSSEILFPSECLVFEDSPWGIQAAQEAGMKCAAVLTSYPREKLGKADLIVPHLGKIEWKEVERLFEF